MPSGTDNFVGIRLTEVREARGYSITELVKTLQGRVTVAAISQYEKGDSTPRPEIAELLAEKLEIPFSYFLQESPVNDTGVVFWRSFASATKTARTRAKRRFVWLKQMTEYLKDYLEFPELNFPNPKDIGVPNDPTKLTHQELDEIAQRCREFWKLGDTPLANIVSVLENNGAIVSRSSIFSDKLDAFSQFSDKGGTPYIFLSTEKNSAVRSRLDAAHELSHLILHRDLTEEQFNDKEIHNKLEKDAFYFGTAFLFPKRAFIEEFKYPTLDSCLYLKRKWKVSIGALILRAKDLGKIEDIQAERLWINYARRGWKKQEPLDDTLLPENPRLLKKGFEFLVNEGIKTPDQILEDLSLSANDIQELTGLQSNFFSENFDSFKLRLKR